MKFRSLNLLAALVIIGTPASVLGHSVTIGAQLGPVGALPAPMSHPALKGYKAALPIMATANNHKKARSRCLEAMGFAAYDVQAGSDQSPARACRRL